MSTFTATKTVNNAATNLWNASIAGPTTANKVLTLSTAGKYMDRDVEVTITKPTASTISVNQSLPSGATSSGTINRNTYIKISSGYVNGDKYYLAQADAHGNIGFSNITTTTTSSDTAVPVVTTAGASALRWATAFTVPSGKTLTTYTNTGTTTTLTGNGTITNCTSNGTITNIYNTDASKYGFYITTVGSANATGYGSNGSSYLYITNLGVDASHEGMCYITNFKYGAIAIGAASQSGAITYFANTSGSGAGTQYVNPNKTLSSLQVKAATTSARGGTITTLTVGGANVDTAGTTGYAGGTIGTLTLQAGKNYTDTSGASANVYTQITTLAMQSYSRINNLYTSSATGCTITLGSDSHSTARTYPTIYIGSSTSSSRTTYSQGSITIRGRNTNTTAGSEDRINTLNVGESTTNCHARITTINNYGIIANINAKSGSSTKVTLENGSTLQIVDGITTWTWTRDASGNVTVS